MSSWTKKSARNEGAKDSNFAVNWEVQAEQLKYTVKKEVEEGNLIEEALKSLQRSFNYEKEKSTHAEKQRQDLLRQVEELEKAARQLEEQIRFARQTRKGASASEDSDSDDGFDEQTEQSTEEMHEKDLDDMEFEQLVSELADDDISPLTRQGTSGMSVQQRLKILRELDSDLRGEIPQELTLTEIKEQHRRVMREWIQRDNQTQLYRFNSSHRFVLDDEHLQARTQLLTDFLEEEQRILPVSTDIIEKYLRNFLQENILTKEHLSIVFSNMASFQPIHNNIIEITQEILAKSDSMLDTSSDFFTLGSAVSRHANTFMQFLTTRSDSVALLKMASDKKRFAQFLESKGLSIDEFITLQDQLEAYIAQFPTRLMNFLPHLDESEYEQMAEAIIELCSVLEQTVTPYTTPPFSRRLHMYFVQYSFDWMNKDGSFVAPGRSLLEHADVKIRRKNAPTEHCHFYLFSDAIVISRGYKQRQLFESFIPLEHLTFWDVPPRSNNQEFIIELIDLRDGSRTAVLCANVEEQDALVDALVDAIQDLTLPSAALEFNENNELEYIWGRKWC